MESSPLAQGAFCPDLAVMQLNNRADDGEAQPDSRDMRVDTFEPAEDAVEEFRRDAVPFV